MDKMYPPTHSQVQSLLKVEQKVIHLMLKSLTAIHFFEQAGVTAEWFEPLHHDLVQAIYDNYRQDCLLTADGYRHVLVQTGYRQQAPLLMESFAKCDLQVYADEDDLPMLLDSLKDSFVRRRLNDFGRELIKEDASMIEVLSKQLEPLNNVYARVTQGGASAFKPIRVCDIADDPEPQWVWGDYIAKGEITLFSGLPKSGKTTLLASVMDMMATGGSLITPVTAAKVLVVSEERARVWKKRGPQWQHVDVVCKPQMDWSTLVDHVCRYVSENHIDVVVIDTLSEHAQLEDENDSSKVLKSLRYGDKIVETGAALVYLHHNRKSGGDYGLGARGSNAIVGKVDIVVTVNRVGVDNEDNRRKLDLISRLSPSKTATITWDGCQYAYVSNTDSHMDEDITYLMAIPADPPGVTLQEIIDHWSEGDVPAKRTVQTRLQDMWRAKRIHRTGEGHRFNPYRYHRIKP